MMKKKSIKTAKTKKQPARSKKESAKAAVDNPAMDVRKAVTKRAESAIKTVKKAEAAVVAAARSLGAKEKEAAGPKKQYLKSKSAAKVTFRLPHEAAPDARSVSVVGDFNSWHADANPMKRLRDGSFTTVIELERGHEYRFRYLIEGGRWENDWHADKYAPNAFGSEDSVVDV